MPSSVRIVILNYNGGEHVLRSVDAALALEWPRPHSEVVVVDNASTDGSVEAIAARHPEVRIVRNPVNTGFSANNLAMDDLDDVAYVALVNPDAFVEPEWLAPLVDAMEGDPGLGAVCPRILLEPRFVEIAFETMPDVVPRDDRALGVRISGVQVDGRDRLAQVIEIEGVTGPEGRDDADRWHWTAPIARLGVPLPPDGAAHRCSIRLDAPSTKSVRIGAEVVTVTPTPTWFDVSTTGTVFDVVNNAGSVLVEGGWGADRGLGTPDGPAFDQPAEVFAWCGGGVLLRSAYLRDVGLFDPDFFLYYEDTDLSWRGRGRGWRYRYVPDAVMRHVHGASTVIGSPMFVFNVERNRLVMLVKNAPWRFAMRAVLLFVVNTAGVARGQIVVPILRRQRPQFRTTLTRLHSLAAVVVATPRTMAKRRAIRRGFSVPDDELLGWQVPQP